MTNINKYTNSVQLLNRVSFNTLLNRLSLVILCLGFWTSNTQAQVTVNPGGGSYATLNAAFAAINAGTHTGAITITITNNTVEPAVSVPLLKSAAPSNYTSITIRPSGGNWVINSAVTPTASRGIFELNGADNVTIDGDDPGTAGTRNLLFTSATSTSTGIALIRLSSTSLTGTDGADNITIRNCSFLGSRSSATSTTVNYGIVMSNSSSITTGAYSSLNTIIENNEFMRCYRGVYANGASATYPNTGLRIRNNVFGSATASNNIGSNAVFITYTSTTAGTAASAIIEGNDIRVGDVSASGSGYSASISGIEIGTVNAGAIVRKNNIHDILQPSTSGFGAFGINITGSTNCNDIEISNNILNNIVASKYSTTSLSTFVAYGIRYSAGATLQKINYNTIRMAAAVTGTVANYSNYGIALGVSGVTVSEMKNNIVVNENIGTGTFAVYTAATTNISAGASNNNNFYAPSGNVGYYNAVARVTLGDWQGASGQDAASFSVNPGFVSTSNLHISIASPAMNGVGTPVAGITTDYDGDLRNVTTPDIGADEYTPLGCASAGGGTISPSSISACNGQFVTMNAVGADVGAGITYTWEISSTGGGVGFSPVVTGSGFNTVNYTTAALSTGTYYYRLKVDCSNGPVTGYSNEVQVTVATPLSGTYLIDNTGAGDYLSFAAALADLGCKGIGGPVTFNVTAGQVFNEASNLECTFTGSAVNTITFQKLGAGANPVVNRIGTSASTDYVIKLTGVDYYTFNGIDFGQTGTSSTDWVDYGIWITNSSATEGAKNNTFKNGTVSLSNTNTSAKGVYIQSVTTPTSLTGTQSNNRFLNMTVQNSWEGYRITGATTTYMDDANEINTESGGSSNINNLGDGVGTGGLYGVFSTYQTNHKIQNTTISGLNVGGTTAMYAITVQTSASNSAVISDNEIYNMNGGGTLYGIYFSSADTADIYNNEIYGLTTNGASSAVRGIYLTATGLNAKVYGNIIYNITSTGTSTGTAAGIDVGTGLEYNIYNNMVSDIKAPASTTTSAGTRGISVSGGSTGGIVRIYNNTVVLNDVSAVAGYTSAALHNSSSTPTLDVRNNIFINLSDISTGTRVAAFYKTFTTDNFDNNSNNNLYYAGNPDPNHLIYYDGTNSALDMVTYQALSAILPAEGASVTENTVFDPIVGGIIRPEASNPTYVESGGQSVAFIITDFEGDTRSATPDLGADEGNFTQQLPPAPDCATLVSPADGTNNICGYTSNVLSWTPPTSGGPVTLGYDVYFGTTPSPAFVANTTSLSYTVSGLSPNTTYYWSVIPKNAGGEPGACTVYSFTTLDAQVTGTTPATRCGTGTVTLGATGSGTLNWYAAASGGAILGTGSSFTTPVINATTDFYVGASVAGTPYVTGRIASSNPGTATTLSTYGLDFTLTEPIVLNSVDVFSSTGTAVVINLYNAAGTTVLQTTGTVSTATAVQNTIPLGFSIAPGTYRLHIVTTGNFYRENSGPVYPISLGGVGQINGFFSALTGAVTTSASYYFMYNWNVTSSCSSSRQMVTATVTPSDPITITPSTVTRCQNDAPTTLTASSTYAYNYTWAPAAGLNTTSGAAVDASPATTTTYTVTGDDGVCANTATVTVTVNAAPGSPSAVATVNPVCEGGSTTLNASAFVPGYTMNPAASGSFVDISTTGTAVGTVTDDSEHNITLPFSFTFNGVAYTTARVGANGAVVLGSTTGEISTANVAIPSASAVGTAGTTAVLMPWWDDLDVNMGGTVYTQQIGSVFYIQWHNVDHNLFTTGTVRFQIQLNQLTGIIKFVYDDVVFGSATYDAGLTGTVGIQLNSTTAFQHSFNAASLTNGQVISFEPTAITYAWTGPNGYANTGASVTITSAAATNNGLYTAVMTGLNGCTSAATVNLSVGAQATANAGSNASICSNQTYTLSGASATNYSSLLWTSNGDGGFDDATALNPVYTPGSLDISNGTVTLTLTAGSGAPCANGTSSMVLSVLPVVSYYTDADGDGYGTGTAQLYCVNPGAGYSTTAGDCDDNNNAIYPGATEVCNGIDDDCSGTVDDNLTPLAAPAAISGPASGCLPGVAGTASFSTTAVAGATGYAWSVPAGMTITSGQGTLTINVAYTNIAIQSGISGSLCVYAVNACQNGPSTCVNIDYQVAAPVTPNSISGPGKVCPGDVVTYSIAAVARATSYTWSVPTGMSIQSGQGSNVVSVQVTAGYLGGTISVTASNVCGTSAARSKSLTQNLPATPSAISGQKDGLCNTTGNVYSIPSVVAATSYTWTTSGATITGGNGTTSITADVAALTGTGTITVQAVNGCGSSLVRSLTIAGAPARPGVISGSTAVCSGATEPYSVATVAGAASYNWSVTANGTIATGQGTKNITTTWGAAAAGQASNVTTSNACGTSLTRSLSGITISNCPRLSDEFSSLQMVIMPNPATAFANVQFNASQTGDYRLRITDVTGRVVFMQDANAGTGMNTIVLDLSTYASGTYTVELNFNGEQQVSRLMVE